MKGQQSKQLIVSGDSQELNLEQQLRDYQNRIASILESFTDGFFEVDSKWVITYWNKEAERSNLVSANLKGLPPATIITAEIDRLQSEGMLLADKLGAAGVKVDSKNYDGVTHEFFGMGAVVSEARELWLMPLGN